MKILNIKKIKGLKIIKTTNHYDNRGYLKEVYRYSFLKNTNFIFDIMSCSKKNVVRGLHYQITNPQAKIITVTHGEIFDVAVDLRKKSKTYGKHYSIILSDKNSTSLFIPAGFAHGLCGLEKDNLVFYGCSNYRSKKNEIAILWNDKTLNIKWPTRKPIISSKDKNNITFRKFEDLY